jgi:hypothetical protein
MYSGVPCKPEAVINDLCAIGPVDGRVVLPEKVDQPPPVFDVVVDPA